MSQQPPAPDQPDEWRGWYPPPAQPPAMPPGWLRFDPSDPLVSNDYAGWWRRGFGIVRAGWRPMTLVQLIAVVPILVVLTPAQVFADLAQRDLVRASAATGELRPAQVLVALGVLAVALLITGVIYTIGTLATARMVVTVATGGQPRVGEALGAVVHRVPAMIGWYLVAGLLTFLAFLACILPVFYVAAALTILPTVVLFERGGIARCFRLFHTDLGAAIGRVATIAGLGLAAGMVFAMMTFTVTLVTEGTAFIDPSAAVSTGAVVTGSVLTSVLNGLSYLVSGVVLTPLIVATYADLRARHEPFSTAYLVDGPAA